MQSPALDSRDLVLMCALHEHGGVTRAARALGLTQSAVSHHLARLEGKLGLALFVREGRGLSITPAGRTLVQGGAPLIEQLTALERALRPTKATRIRVATQCHTCYDWLAPVIGRFRRAHPTAQVVPKIDHRKDPMKALLGRRIDLAIAHAPAPKETVVFELGQDAFVVVLLPSHPAAGSRGVGPRDLVDDTLIVHDLPVDELVAIGRDWFGSEQPAHTLRMPLTEAMVELVVASCGVALIPRWAAKAARSRDDVVVRPFVHPRAHRTWRAAIREADQDRADLQALIAELSTWFAQEAG